MRNLIKNSIFLLNLMGCILCSETLMAALLPDSASSTAVPRPTLTSGVSYILQSGYASGNFQGGNQVVVTTTVNQLCLSPLRPHAIIVPSNQQWYPSANSYSNAFHVGDTTITQNGNNYNISAYVNIDMRGSDWPFIGLGWTLTCDPWT